MKFQKPDGTIEFGNSGCCCPPGKQHEGWHTNAGTLWWRIDDGEWQSWTAGLLRLQRAADEAATCAAFKEKMEPRRETSSEGNRQ